MKTRLVKLAGGRVFEVAGEAPILYFRNTDPKTTWPKKGVFLLASPALVKEIKEAEQP